MSMTNVVRTTLVAGNWKMYGNKAEILSLVTGIKNNISQVNNVNIAIFPPFVYLDYVIKAVGDVKGLAVGAQNMAEEPLQGAFTGEVSSSMLKDVGCKYVILGHSERRSIYGETDYQVAKKVKVAIKSGLMPILCVGETLEERESLQAETVISRQLNAVIEVVGIENFSKLIIAYEPVWAIGTGKTATPEQAQQIHNYIRCELSGKNETIALNLSILYGGSVKPDNAKELFKQPDIDGALVGGASLKSKDFIDICKAS